jgi:hypothetical protein
MVRFGVPRHRSYTQVGASGVAPPQDVRGSERRLETCHAGRACSPFIIQGAAPVTDHRAYLRGSSGSASLPACCEGTCLGRATPATSPLQLLIDILDAVADVMEPLFNLFTPGLDSPADRFGRFDG